MELYWIYLHIICAFLSLGLLIVRGGMQLTRRNWRAVKLLKILPHLTDTLLILSGIVMLFKFNFGLESWIMAKIVLLCGYIIFSAKFFSKKQSQNRPHFFFLALAALVATILIGYFH